MTDEPQKPTQDVQEAVEGGDEATTPSPGETEATVDTSQEAETEEVSEGETEGETESGEDAGQSKRAESRQHELAQKLKSKDVENNTLRQQLEKLQGGTNPQTEAVSQDQGLPWWNDQSQEDRQLTPEEYQAHVNSRADTIVQARLGQFARQQAQINNFEKDLTYLEENYPELKENKELNKQITEVFEDVRKGNPNASLKKLAEPMLKARTLSREEGKGEAMGALAKQMADASATPETASGKRQSTEEEIASKLKSGEMTAEEAEGHLSVVRDY